MQVTEQPHPLLQRSPPSNRAGEYRSNRPHEEVAVVGGAAPRGRPQVSQEGHVGRAGEHGTLWAGGEGK